MFLNFQKITNGSADVIVKADSIIIIESDPIVVDGVSYPSATRIEVPGYPKQGFYTKSSFDQVTSVIRTLDVVDGYDPESCGATIVSPSVSHPLIKTNKINNSTISELEPYAFNPNYLVSAEEYSFTDIKTKNLVTGLMIVLYIANPRRIITKMTLNELKMMLKVIEVPHI